jgi:threonine/homoserine/homoserine lactone efflux protein
MPDPSMLALFSVAALLLLIIPGPAVIYIVTRGTSQGRAAALTSVAGIHTGTLVHIGAAVAGLSALIVASATAFTIIKIAGAAYLVYLGLVALFRRPDNATDAATASPPRTTRRIYLDGVVLNILNPKTAVFFLAFVPQFVNAGNGSTTGQILILGVVFVLLGLLTDGAYAVAAGWIGTRLSRSRRAERRKDVLSGSVYLALGVTTAFAGTSTTG